MLARARRTDRVMIGMVGSAREQPTKPGQQVAPCISRTMLRWQVEIEKRPHVSERSQSINAGGRGFLSVLGGSSG